jgi:hypothetical protein
MRSKEVFDYSRSTGYPWSVAASTIRVADQSEGPGPPRAQDEPGLGTTRQGVPNHDHWPTPHLPPGSVHLEPPYVNQKGHATRNNSL